MWKLLNKLFNIFLCIFYVIELIMRIKNILRENKFSILSLVFDFGEIVDILDKG